MFIGNNVHISEYSVIYGPAVILDNTRIGPHTSIRGGCVIGENCTVSGEMKNVLMLGNSNKGHFGYFGDSIVGEFCNIGAGTSTSNLKNNFHEVKIYNPLSDEMTGSGLKKVGSFIGHFSTTAVNTVLTAGTTIGVMCNVYGETHYPNYMKCFSWGLNKTYRSDVYKDTALALMESKKVSEETKNEVLSKLEAYYNKVIGD